MGLAVSPDLVMTVSQYDSHTDLPYVLKSHKQSKLGATFAASPTVTACHGSSVVTCCQPSNYGMGCLSS